MDVLLRWKLESRKGDFRREDRSDWEIASTGGRCVSALGFWLIGLLNADVKACTLAHDRTSNWFFMLSVENSCYWLIICGNNSPVKEKQSGSVTVCFKVTVAEFYLWSDDWGHGWPHWGFRYGTVMVATEAHKWLF